MGDATDDHLPREKRVRAADQAQQAGGAAPDLAGQPDDLAGMSDEVDGRRQARAFDSAELDETVTDPSAARREEVGERPSEHPFDELAGRDVTDRHRGLA